MSSIPCMFSPMPRRLWTPGMYALLVVVAIGVVGGADRFLIGLQDTTNLDQQYPWGIWIVADVSFIALAAGGFATAALIHVLHRTQYHLLARPALVLALLGYTSACLALAADLGRYYNIWHPILPQCWQGNSALFEVGMCVMCYLTVLWIEFVPVVCERFRDDPSRPRLKAICTILYNLTERWMAVFVVLGVGISCLHQSSLGNVMVLAGYKLNALWQTPVLALLFLVSAIAVGFSTVIFVFICTTWTLRIDPQMNVLSRAARYVPLLLSVYLAIKIGDMLIRHSYVELAEFNVMSASFLVEMVVGLMIPIVMTLFARVRASAGLLAVATGMAGFGIVLNRANVYWIGYRPPYTDKLYIPTLTEWTVVLGVVAAALIVWRVIMVHLPVISTPEQEPSR